MAASLIAVSLPWLGWTTRPFIGGGQLAPVLSLTYCSISLTNLCLFQIPGRLREISRHISTVSPLRWEILQ